MTTDDIEGSWPKKHKVTLLETREIMKVDDIDGTKYRAKIKDRNRSPHYNAYDYSDITKINFKSKRCVNPLNPIYDVHDDKGLLI